jgi:hypothetical protein
LEPAGIRFALSSGISTPEGPLLHFSANRQHTISGL